MAYKIHGLFLKHRDHQMLLGDYKDGNFYYRAFLNVVVRREPIDVTMELVSSLVPHVWTPMSQFYEALIREVQAQSGYHHLPKIWMDLQVSEFCSIKRHARFELMKLFSDVVIQADLEALNIENLRDAFVRIANDIFTELSSTADSRHLPLSKNNIAAPLCNNVLRIALKQRDDKLAMKVVSFCRQEVTQLVGSLDGSLLDMFLDAMISNGEKNSAVDCVVFAAEQRMPESIFMAKRLIEAFSLDDVEKNQLNLLFAHEIEWTKL